MTASSASSCQIMNRRVLSSSNKKDEMKDMTVNDHHPLELTKKKPTTDDDDDGTSLSTSSVTNEVNVANDKKSNDQTSSILYRNKEIWNGSIVQEGILEKIPRLVVRQKLNKMRHLVIPEGIRTEYLDSLFPDLLSYFHPQSVSYNGGIGQIPQWKISCYLEVMKGGIPCTNPNIPLLNLFRPLLDTCNELFLQWYRQQHACNNNRRNTTTTSTSTDPNGTIQHRRTCRRLMTFITRYTPAPGEQALLKHIDGAGKVDGSVVVALPIDRWSASEEENSFIGNGGGLTFWDGRKQQPQPQPPPQEESQEQQLQPRRRLLQSQPQEIHYDTRSGDIAFIDRAVWHQADPITKGTRWALVIFYKLEEGTS